jgi:hypothetical protein
MSWPSETRRRGIVVEGRIGWKDGWKNVYDVVLQSAVSVTNCCTARGLGKAFFAETLGVD